VKAYRIAGTGHPVFDGTGAELSGGRWNSRGRAVIYAGESFAIAILERLVRTAIGKIPAGDRYVEIVVPDDVGWEMVDPAGLPGWDAADPGVARGFGDRWIDERRSAMLFVPSAVTRLDRNVVINPLHPDFNRIAAGPERRVDWDRRLFRRA
jgi:RES domain-containing protein